MVSQKDCSRSDDEPLHQLVEQRLSLLEVTRGEAFGEPGVERPANPERVPHPKERLKALVWAASRKRYVNTIHNVKIARELSIARLKTCPVVRRVSLFRKRGDHKASLIGTG